MNFRLPTIDHFSFWFGLILATLFWWIISLIRPAFRYTRIAILKRWEEIRRNRNNIEIIENNYLQRVFINSQSLHIAASLFSLDEIIEPPKLMVRPLHVEPGIPLQDNEIITIIPYLPAWPELAATYGTSTISLSQALSKKADIVIVGQPGTGKTVTMAHLASQLARKVPDLGLPSDTIPFFFHVGDLIMEDSEQDPLKPLIKFLIEGAPNFDKSRIPGFVHRSFSDGRALILLDGADELPPDDLNIIVGFIKRIKVEYPQTRVVISAGFEFLDGLIKENFIPFSIAAWDLQQRKNFLERWGNLWSNFVAVDTSLYSGDYIDPVLLNTWLIAENKYMTPLEMTLKVWEAYAGDLRGNNNLDFIETYLRRIAPIKFNYEVLEMLSFQVTLNLKPFFELRKIREWLKSFEPSGSSNPSIVEGDPVENDSEKNYNSVPEISANLTASGLLTKLRNNTYRFCHPVFLGYLSGKFLANKNYCEDLLDQPNWIGKNLSLQFFAAFGEATTLVDKFIAIQDRPLFRNIFTLSSWLRYAPSQATWRNRVITNLIDILRLKGQPLGLRGQALCAIIRSGDPGAPFLFRQLLEEQDNELIGLVALGSGILQDKKAIDILARLLKTHYHKIQQSICLALVNIGTTASLDTVADALLHGDENLRIAAAEALANLPGEGFAMLKEGAGMKEDLLVRRSVVFGLGRIQESWSDDLLDHLIAEDDQWAVSNAAAQTLEKKKNLDPYIPKSLPPPSESPWIIAYAGKQGIGVSPGRIPLDLLLSALTSGNKEERLASLSYLRFIPEQNIFNALFQVMYNNEPILREYAFNTIVEMAASGVDIPDPEKTGYRFSK